TAVSDSSGNYRIDFLQPGDYQVQVEAAGFRRAEVSEVTVHVNEIRRADVQLEVGPISEEVVVTSTSDVGINTENPTLGQVINEQIIENMPLNGREFVE